MIIKAILAFLLFSAVCETQTHFIFGCGRKFKNGRKCSRWDCPNKCCCGFSKYFDDSNGV